MDVLGEAVFQDLVDAIHGVVIGDGNGRQPEAARTVYDFGGRQCAVGGRGVNVEINAPMRLITQGLFLGPLPWFCSRCTGWSPGAL